MDSTSVSPLFHGLQWLLLLGVVLLILRFLKSQEPESRFKPRSKKIENKKSNRAPKKNDPGRMLLQGIVLTGLPHQILGIREDASEFEIRKAHRTLIKRFHPDKVGPEGSKQWYEAQRASEAINGARDLMLKKNKLPNH